MANSMALRNEMNYGYTNQNGFSKAPYLKPQPKSLQISGGFNGNVDTMNLRKRKTGK